MAVKFIFSYARSGGTMLARCIDAMPDTIVLSEVHPIYHTNGTIKEQVKKRYHIELLSEGYEANIAELSDLCNEKNWQLIIRDWTFIDFTPHRINHFEPSYAFTAYNLLKKQGKVKAMAFVRNPIDIWISRGCPPKFFEAYQKFVDELKKKGIASIKYEEFCADHMLQMKEICDLLNLPFHKGYQQFYTIDDMPGDSGSHPDSRGNQTSTISVFPRRYISKSKLRLLEGNQYLINSNAHLGYSSNYSEGPLEAMGTFQLMWKKLKSLLQWNGKSDEY